uniref:Histone-lysine N-methyltransferase SETMAR n=1 Tax=Caenorhabditis japonica TaxID=281687 RepID=A0A8R1HRC4_CAEJA
MIFYWKVSVNAGMNVFKMAMRAWKTRSTTAAIESDPCQTTRSLAEQFACTHGTIENHLHAIGLDMSKTKFLRVNARPHVAKVTQQEIDELGWEVLPYPPYGPDLAPSDFRLFRSMQNSSAGKQFNKSGEVEKWVVDYFEPQPAEFFDRGIHSLRGRWHQVIDNDGEYLLDVYFCSYII